MRGASIRIGMIEAHRREREDARQRYERNLLVAMDGTYPSSRQDRFLRPRPAARACFGTKTWWSSTDVAMLSGKETPRLRW